MKKVKFTLSVFICALLVSCSGGSSSSQDEVWLIPVDWERYNQEFPDAKVYRKIGEIHVGRYAKAHLGGLPHDVLETNSQAINKSKSTEILVPSDKFPDMKIGKIYKIEEDGSNVEEMPLYLKKDLYKKVGYKGSVYQSDNISMDYNIFERNPDLRENQISGLNYAEYRKQGIKGPIVCVTGMHVSPAENNININRNLYVVSIVDEYGYGKTKFLPIKSMTTEEIRINEVAEVQWYNGEIILKRLPVFLK